mmetsp:Transcript_37226/g.58176  ORF Transcript_37226/g.58176 Transcript_37226/m.58176 type:complete len:80 (+) Transcript_37226:609-848(+)
MHVSTHGESYEYGIIRLFSRLGWHCIAAFPGSSTYRHMFHTMRFGDGHQAWVNPQLVDIETEFAVPNPLSHQGMSNPRL